MTPTTLTKKAYHYMYVSASTHVSKWIHDKKYEKPGDLCIFTMTGR